MRGKRSGRCWGAVKTEGLLKEGETDGQLGEGGLLQMGRHEGRFGNRNASNSRVFELSGDTQVEVLWSLVFII